MNHQAIIVIGLGFGDEGKGSIVDYLVRKHGVKTVVRFSGGSQAAHHVVIPEGVTHCFAQFGSGTLVPGVRTFLSRYVLVDPLAMVKENNALVEKGITDAFSRTSIDRHCVLITPFHKILNRMKEISLGNVKKGSCGKGVGEAVRDSQALGKTMTAVMGDFFDLSELSRKLKFLWHWKIDQAEGVIKAHQEKEGELVPYLEQLQAPGYVECLIEKYESFRKETGVSIRKHNYLPRILKEETVIFEGTQGVLLDSEYGFWPYVTLTRTTPFNALQLLLESKYQGKVKTVGVIRAYSTRHGAGPFVTEDEWLTRILPDPHNQENEWQGMFRVGWFDMVAAKYALQIAEGEVDEIALTCLDQLIGLDMNVCVGYEYGLHHTNSALIGSVWNMNEKGRVIIKSMKSRWHRETQTTTLQRDCKPVYEGLLHPLFDPHKNIEEVKERGEYRSFVKWLEDRLGVKVSIVSFGPTWKDKVEQL